MNSLITRTRRLCLLAVGLVTMATLAAGCGSSSPVSSVPHASKHGVLARVCPNPVRIALDWTPQAELGGYYQLAAPNGAINASQKTYTAALIDPFTGKPAGVNVELMAGGPAVGYLFAEEVLYEEPDVLLGVDATDTQVTVYSKTPTVAIAAPMELYPTILFWNPAKYHFSGIRAIRSSGAKVEYYTGAGYMAYLTSSGVLSKSQVQGGYNGSPGTWVASGGSVVSQGFAESEPYVWTHELPAWDKTVAYQLVQDLGYRPYEEITITRPQNITRYAACFRKLVPMIQQAEINYVEHPAHVNSLIVRLIADYKVGGPYSMALARYAVSTMLADRIISQPPTGAFGSFDMSRVESVIKLLENDHAVSGLPAGFNANSIATNKFINPNIRMTFYHGPYNNINGVITVKGVHG